jgi:serine/threonine protein kinase
MPSFEGESGQADIASAPRRLSTASEAKSSGEDTSAPRTFDTRNDSAIATLPAINDPRELMGFQMGDYVIDDFVGVGGQAAVYAAHLPEFPQRKYALKVFGLMQSGPSGLEVGLKESRKVASIDHPSVVRLYRPAVAEVEYQGSVHRVLYLPMDYANGGNCDESPPFKDKHLSVADIRSMIELLDGLQAIHQEIIHEDIKPANILRFQERLEGEERTILRIADFGIARIRNAALGVDLEDPIGMTKEFMPPELADHRHGEKGDIYSMGATLFYMVTGVLPIEPPSEESSDPYSSLLAWQHAHQDQPRPNAMKFSVFCPPRLALLIMRMMGIDPNDRPDLEECKRELRQIIKTHDLQVLQRLEMPKALEVELSRDEFPILYVPEDFRGIFKPKIHEIFESQLFVIRIKMGHQVFSQYKVIIEYMIRRFSDCFCLYETWGTCDVNILVWTKHDEAAAISLKRRLEERLAGARVEIRTASKIHDFHCDDPSVPESADPVFALAVQERIRLPGLNPDEYLCKEFPADITENSVRAFTYVGLVDAIRGGFIRNAVIRNVKDKLAELMVQDKSSRGTPRFHRMSMIELLPPDPALAGDDAAVLVVNFVASKYKYVCEIPSAIIETIQTAVNATTFVESGRITIQSDKILF